MYYIFLNFRLVLVVYSWDWERFVLSLLQGCKTAIIEKEELGCICLNWGCIPTKALLKSAQVFEYIQHANKFGINIDSYKLNLKESHNS